MADAHFFVPHPRVQLERARRYVKRLRDSYDGREFTRHSETLEWEDDMYSTFVHIHHVKDWFPTKELRKSAETFSKGSTHLNRCGWIANLWKHANKDRSVPAKIGRLPTHTKIFATNVPALDRPPQVRFPFVFVYNDGRSEEFEAIELAEDGLKEWEGFINQAMADGRLAPMV